MFWRSGDNMLVGRSALESGGIFGGRVGGTTEEMGDKRTYVRRQRGRDGADQYVFLSVSSYRPSLVMNSI